MALFFVRPFKVTTDFPSILGSHGLFGVLQPVKKNPQETVKVEMVVHPPASLRPVTLEHCYMFFSWYKGSVLYKSYKWAEN